MSYPARQAAPKVLKQDDVQRRLRDEIIAGKYAAGSRLPTRAELEKRFDASRFTVQVALDALTRDGFVRSRGRGGTVVVDRPPHLHNFEFVFEHQPNGPHWTRFLQALANEASARDGADGRRISVFMGTLPHSDNEHYQNLLRMTAARRLAGIIFATTPVPFRGTPLMVDDGIPRVAIMERDEHYTQVHQVYPDVDLFFEQALRRLREMGCRRVAVLTTRITYDIHGSHIHAQCAKLGLTCPPYWTHVLWEPVGIRNVVHLMFREQQKDRPDGLLIADDNLVEHALAGLLAARVSPDELKVIAYGNFPSALPTLFPLTRAGVCVPSVLNACLELLERARCGETVPLFTGVRPVFEQELKTDRN